MDATSKALTRSCRLAL